MHYRELPPPSELQDSVECIWELRTGNDPPTTQRIVPDGTVELIFHRGTPFTRLQDGKRLLQPRAFVVGQSNSPFMVASASNADTFGIRLRAEAVRAITGVPANLLTNEAIPLDALGRNWCAFARQALDCGPAVPILRSLPTVTRRKSTPAEIAAAVAQLRHRHGNIGIDRLATVCNVSTRKLQRLFREHIGLPPKLLARIFRFQHVFHLTGTATATEWAQVALECGYVDQAHLIRDFREFAGEPPTALLGQESDLAEIFLRAKRVSHFSNRAAAAIRQYRA